MLSVVRELPPASPQQCGDINLDKRIDLSDAVSILKHLFLNTTSSDPTCFDERIED